MVIDSLVVVFNFIFVVELSFGVVLVFFGVVSDVVVVVGCAVLGLIGGRLDVVLCAVVMGKWFIVCGWVVLKRDKNTEFAFFSIDIDGGVLLNKWDISSTFAPLMCVNLGSCSNSPSIKNYNFYLLRYFFNEWKLIWSKSNIFNFKSNNIT